jgi:hypothetical protein
MQRMVGIENDYKMLENPEGKINLNCRIILK